MRILVTGGAGFIGSHVVDAYLKDGHEVCVIDNLSTGDARNINQSAQFYHADIRDNLSMLMKKIKPQVINHHAAQIDVRASVADPSADASVNIIGTLNLIQQGLKNGAKKFIFASSGGAIYGEQDKFPADEAHQTNPLSPYGVAKLSVEKYLYYYKNDCNLDYIALRYSNVYGPRQNPLGEAGVVAIFIHKMLCGEQPVINGNGLQTRDYVYVDDVVKANVKALNCNISGGFNIGTGRETSVNELFEQLSRISGRDIKPVYGHAKKGEQQRSCISNERYRKLMDWTPDIALDSGLKQTYEWFLKNNGR